MSKLIEFPKSPPPPEEAPVRGDHLEFVRLDTKLVGQIIYHLERLDTAATFQEVQQEAMERRALLAAIKALSKQAAIHRAHDPDPRRWGGKLQTDPDKRIVEVLKKADKWTSPVWVPVSFRDLSCGDTFKMWEPGLKPGSKGDAVRSPSGNTQFVAASDAYLTGLGSHLWMIEVEDDLPKPEADPPA